MGFRYPGLGVYSVFCPFCGGSHAFYTVVRSLSNDIAQQSLALVAGSVAMRDGDVPYCKDARQLMEWHETWPIQHMDLPDFLTRRE